MTIQLELPQSFYDAIHDELRTVYREAIEQARKDATLTRELVTIGEASDFCIEASTSTIRKWIKEKGLPTYEMDGKTFIDRQELYDLIRQHKK